MTMSYDASEFLAGLFGSATVVDAIVEPSNAGARPTAADPAALEQAGPVVDDLQDVPAADAEHARRLPLSKPARGGNWPTDVVALTDFVLLLSHDDLPAAPFDFGPAAVVVDAVKFLASIKADIRRGPAGPRARCGAVQADVSAVCDIVLRHADHGARKGTCETSTRPEFVRPAQSWRTVLGDT